MTRVPRAPSPATGRCGIWLRASRSPTVPLAVRTRARRRSRTYPGPVIDDPSPADRVRALILRSWPDRFDADELDDDTAVGETGLGLDSVEVAELLLTCEDESGIALPESLLTEATVPIGRIGVCFWGGAASAG